MGPTPGMRSSVGSSLLQAFRNSGYQWPQVALPDGVEVVGPAARFRFELPWPWYLQQAEPDDPKSGSADEVVVVAPRTDGRDPVFQLWIDQGELQLDAINPKRYGQRMAAPLVRHATVGKVVIDGRRALLVEGSFTREYDAHAFVLCAPCGQEVVRGQCVVPAGEAAGYRAHIESMLATWVWT